jgi:hypothetical protein
MKLYHGTSLRVAQAAVAQGITPRGHAKGNWETCPSHPELVYLSECYAPYFAMSSGDDSDFSIAIIEVDTDLLDEANMRPDEDFLEQISRERKFAKEIGVPSTISTKDMVSRTRWFRDRHSEYAFLWRASLKMLGNCAYLSSVPASAITRVAAFDLSSNVAFMCGIDPTITLLNYRILGPYYREVTKWFFDNNVDSQILTTFGMRPDVIANRRGLSVIK